MRNKEPKSMVMIHKIRENFSKETNKMSNKDFLDHVHGEATKIRRKLNLKIISTSSRIKKAA